MKSKHLRLLAFSLLAAVLIVGCFGIMAPTAKAQSQATVVIMSFLGGTTTPAAGTYTYASGTTVTVSATSANNAYFFSSWIVSNSSTSNAVITTNPLVFTVTGGVTYVVQPVFQPLNTVFISPLAATINNTSAAIVVVVASVGGTTTPGPGTYAVANATSLNLTAIPDPGWKFDNWVIGGYPLSHGAYSFTDTPTNNPYNVDHGYGYTYYYQPVFSPTSTTKPSTSPTIPEYSGAAVIAVILALALAAFGTYELARRKKK